MKISVVNEPYSENTYKVVCLSKDQGNGGWDTKKGGKYPGQAEGTWKRVHVKNELNLTLQGKDTMTERGQHVSCSLEDKRKVVLSR